MKIILLERVPNLGQMGSVIEVKPGYARNYLLPKAKALRATKENIALFENKRIELEATNLQKKTEAEDLSKKLEGLILTIIRQAGDSGHLYGSVAARDIADALVQKGVKVERNQISLVTPIKEIGTHNAQLLLHPEVSLPVTLVVAQTEEEAQAKVQLLKKSDKNTEEEK